MMKNTIFLITFLLGVFIYAQEDHREINTGFKELMDTTFESLEKDRVPHGILLDFGMEFTNVPAFNGTLTDSTYTDATTLKQIYNTLLMSRIVSEEQTFVTPEQFSQNWQDNRSSGHIALSGMYYKYSAFGKDAYPERLHYEGGQFTDKYEGETWLDPYEEKQTFAIAPPILWHKGLSFDVLLPQEIFYSNAAETISYIEADFDDGQGYRELSMDEAVSVDYEEEGNKIWKYRAVLNSEEVLYAQSKIKIIAGLERKAWSSGIQSGHTTYAQDITATTAYLGQYGKVTITIDLANPSVGIQKPLIVAEGFDIGTLLDPENTEGMQDYEVFREELLRSGNQLRALIRETAKEYDIIYVDWNNGADYLQRNAYALQAAIAWINQEKSANGSTEPNVVLGQSMGGVIARYALTDMEEKDLDHNTRLFISHDAPQQGANIPMGLQYMYRHMTNQYITASSTLFGGTILVPLLENNFGVSSYLSILDTPASRQMLKIWSDTGYGMTNTVHDNFYAELKGLNNNDGYPTETRNIAISNGSECGDTQGFYAGDHFLSFQYDRGLSFWGDLASLIYNPLGGAIGGLFLDPDFFRATFLGMIPGSSRYIVDFQVKTISYQNNYQIYKGLVRYKKKILWVFDAQVSLTNIQRNQPSNILPYDYYGGGFYDTSDIAQVFTDAFPDAILGDRFGFIPTVSSLDIGAGSATLNDLDYKESYVGADPPFAPKNSPFDNFSTDFNPYNPQAQNYRHLAFNTRNGNWLAEELNGNQPVADCSYACDAGIVGPDDLCSTAVFSVSGGAATYSWSIKSGSGLATITGGNGTNQVTLTKSGNGRGSIVLKVIYGDNHAVCGNYTLTKEVSVGPPLFVSLDPVGDQSGYDPSEPDISLGTGACNQISLQAVFGSHSPILEYQWERITTDVSWSVYPSTGYFTIDPQCNKDFTFKVRARNACGWTAWETLTYAMNRCTGNCGQSGPGTIVGTNFVLSPNPVSQGLIEAKVKNGAPWFTTTPPDPDPMDPGTGTGPGGEQLPVTDFNPIVNITIYNLSGIVVLSFPNSQLPTTLNVSSLSAGSYLMQLEYQGLTESHTIIKQ